jgi:3-dehydroquinate dehydratase II
MPAGTDILAVSPGTNTSEASESHPVRSLQATNIQDVAAAAGVSTATVSRALRGLPRVSQSTRQRIEAAAASLGYVASSAASELARGRPPSRGTIVVVNGPLTGSGNPDERRAPSPAEIEQLVQSVASAHGFRVCIKSCDEVAMLDAVRTAAVSAVGIVINTGGFSSVSSELHSALASALIPAVEIQIDSTCPPQSPACSVLISGAGIYCYKLAIDYLGSRLAHRIQPDKDG